MSSQSKSKEKVLRLVPKLNGVPIRKPTPKEQLVPLTCGNLEELPPKLLRKILFNLDLHAYLQCRLLSQSFKSLVDVLAATYFQVKNPWNPYFGVRRYFDLNTTHVLGITRLESASDVRLFVEKHCPKSTTSLRKTIQGPPSKPAWNSPQGHIKFKQSFKPPPKPKQLQLPSTLFSTLFPSGTLHIRRRLLDYPDESKSVSVPPADSHTTLLLWTTRLLQHFGKDLTSFTLDTGKRSGSDLTFTQLRTIILLLPNLRFLGISAGNYEHSEASSSSSSTSLLLFPPHRHLTSVWLGYNTTFHLQMDILNAYGSQLKNISCSKFGYLIFGLPQTACTVNSLQKLLDYVNTFEPSTKPILSSLESLKIPVVSSEFLQTPPPLPNLKRLSLHYLHMANVPTECHWTNIFEFLLKLSSTLQTLSVDFTEVASFFNWLSEENPPSPAPNSSLPHVHSLHISSFALYPPDSSQLALFLANHFPALRYLTFFNWSHLQAALEAGQEQTEDTEQAPLSFDDVSAKLNPFWNAIPGLKTLSVLNDTYDSDWIYHKTRPQE